MTRRVSMAGHAFRLARSRSMPLVSGASSCVIRGCPAMHGRPAVCRAGVADALRSRPLRIWLPFSRGQKVCVTRAVGRLGILAWLGWVCSASSHPCDPFIRTLDATQHSRLTHALERDLSPARVTVLATFAQRDWQLVYIRTDRSDNAYVFYRGDPQAHRLTTLWAGVASPSERMALFKSITMAARGVPTALARCFVWQATDGPRIPAASVSGFDVRDRMIR